MGLAEQILRKRISLFERRVCSEKSKMTPEDDMGRKEEEI
jgi:hypothetical protein